MPTSAGAILAAASASDVIAEDAITLKVSPTASYAPANLVIRASVEPDAVNRAMEVTARSDDFYRASTIPLDVDPVPKTTNLELRDVPSGNTKSTCG
jgi:hypothetical protein